MNLGFYGNRKSFMSTLDNSKSYEIKLDDKAIGYLKDYLVVACNTMDYDDIVMGSVYKKLYEFNQNIDEHIKDNVLVIDRVNLKTFKLILSIVLNDIKDDEDKYNEDYQEFINEINYLNEFFKGC